MASLPVDGNSLSDPCLLSHAFNDYFSPKGSRLALTSEPTEPVVEVNNASQSKNVFNCTFSEVINVIKNLKSKQTCGIDEISNILLKKSDFVTAPYLTFITNLSFFVGKFPQKLKYAKV